MAGAHPASLQLTQAALISNLPASQNGGQGLGFMLGHTVIDRKTLTSAAAKLVTGFTTVYALLLALGGSASAGVEACELSAMQLAGIQAAMMGRNASCAYNMTVAQAIGA